MKGNCLKKGCLTYLDTAQTKLKEVYSKMDINQVNSLLYVASFSLKSSRNLYLWMEHSISCSRTYIYPEQWSSGGGRLSVRRQKSTKQNKQTLDQIFHFQKLCEEGDLPVVPARAADKSDESEDGCCHVFFPLNTITGFVDLKMHAIGQSVHYGRLIEFEKPEQMSYGTRLHLIWQQ